MAEFNYNTNEFKTIPTNKDILKITNKLDIKNRIIKEGEILTVENSDIAFHAQSIIDNLDKSNLENIKHYSPYDTLKRWRPKTIKMMYLLTKNINDNVIKLLKQPIPRFLAVSITGVGGTDIEKNVPFYKDSFMKIKKLIDNGFDVNDIVIRIDPLYPGINTPDVNKKLLESIIKATYRLGITQIYTSVFDIYKSTSHKMKNSLDMNAYSDNLKSDNVIHANEQYLTDIFTEIDNLIYTIGKGKISHILCGEIPTVYPKHTTKIGCLNKARIEQTLKTKVSGIKDRTHNDKNVQRGNCLCVITNNGKKVKRQGLTESQKCGHGCSGCYIGSNAK